MPGKAFINELTKLIQERFSKLPNQDNCKALMVMPSLILQRTSNQCKVSEIKSHVERWLNFHNNKHVEGLMNETRTIQKRLPQRQKLQTTEEKAKIFAKLVLKGKANPATPLLNDDNSSGFLPLSADVIKTLHQKHANAKPSSNTMILHRPLKR